MTTQIAVVGEAWGQHEELQRSPFVGYSGHLLTQMLHEAGIERSQCFLTNVFNLRPKPTDDIINLCGGERGKVPPFSIALAKGHYLLPQYYAEVHRVVHEIRSLRPNIVVLAGNTACWAFLHTTGIRKIRGTVAYSTILPTQKVIPVYHPAAVTREFTLRPVTVIDLQKARLESAFPEVRRPERTIYIEPSLADLEWFYNEHITRARSIAVDIETLGEQITCIGFATSPSVALCIPFHDLRREGHSYWSTEADERAAWGWVRKYLNSHQPKLFQNGLYDLYFLWKVAGLTVRNCAEDSMLMHHALQPESEKGLGFLGSVYTSESSWKLMRKRSDTIKKDD